MDYIYIKARAKINLALDVLGKREDGYHDLKMIMQTVGLYDTLYIKKVKSEGIKLNTNLNFLPVNEKNLVYKAADLLLKKFEIKTGLYMELRKNIPVSAGLAGGSSDCAAALVGIRNLFNLPLTNSELSELGKSLGADVPYCIYRGTILAEGIGDKLTFLKPHPPVNVLLVKPNISVSTESVFKSFNPALVNKRPNIDCLIKKIKKRNIEGIASEFSNVLETVTEREHPIIAEIKKAMIDYKALGSVMSGSGPTVFGYFEDKKDALNAISYIKNTYPEIREISLTNIFNPQRRNG